METIKNIKNILMENILTVLMYLVISFVFLSISLWLLITFNGLNQLDTTFSFLSNITGSLIGGFIAYVVAKTQIDNQKEIEKNRENLKVRNIIALLRTELDFNHGILESVSEEVHSTDKVLTLKKLKLDVWEEAKFMLPLHLKEKTFDRINIHYRIIEELKNNELKLNDTNNSPEKHMRTIKRIRTALGEVYESLSSKHK